MEIQLFKKLISESKHKEILEELISLLDSTEYFDELIILKSIFDRNEKANIKGIISREDYNVEYNKITERILNFLNLISLEENLVTKTEDVFDIVKDISLEHRKSIEKTKRTKEILTNLSNAFKKVDIFLKKLDFNNLKEPEVYKLNGILDKFIRRIILSKRIIILAYEDSNSFFKYYISRIDEIIRIFDIPKDFHSREEIDLLRKIVESLEKGIKEVSLFNFEKSESKSNSILNFTNTQANGLIHLLKNKNCEEAINKIEKLKKENAELISVINEYNPQKVYDKNILKKRVTELVVTIEEIDEKSST